MDEANENCLYRVSAFVFKSDFVVTDSEDIEYLKLRNVGREIQVEVDNNEIVDVICCCVYDILHLADQVVVFDLGLLQRLLKLILYSPTLKVKFNYGQVDWKTARVSPLYSFMWHFCVLVILSNLTFHAITTAYPKPSHLL